MKLEYYYSLQSIQDPQVHKEHDSVLVLLDALKQSRQVTDFVTLDVNAEFPDESSKQRFLEHLRDFSLRHHVRLSRIFGSRKHGFTFLPSQFLLVRESEELREVFPCEISGVEKGIIDFLEALKQGIPWTTYQVPAARKTRHEIIVENIIQRPDVLESGLHLVGRNAQVSQRFGELGYVDLIFKDREDKYLLVEVKVKPGEIDKAIGQILKHRKLFTKQNSVSTESVRLAIAGPNISMQQKEICQEAGIKYFEVA